MIRRSCLSLLALFFVLGASDGSGPSDKDANAETLRRFVQDVFLGDESATRSLLSDDFVFHGKTPLRGPAEMLGLAEQLNAAFADQKYEVQDLIANSDRGAMRWKWTAIHRGEYFGINATGAKVSTWGIVVVHFKNGRITDAWEQWDTAALRAQLEAASKKR